MLQTHIPWLADGYRIRLQQQEKQQMDKVRADGTDSFVLCPEDHIESFAELKVQRPSGPETGGAPSLQTRAHSAQPRLGGAYHTQDEAQDWEDRGGGGGGGGGGGNSPWLAAKRKGGLRFSRPASARNRTYRPASAALPPRPYSAFSAVPGAARGRPPLRKSRPSSAAALKRKDGQGRDSGGGGRAWAVGGGGRARPRPHSASPAAARPTSTPTPTPTRAPTPTRPPTPTRAPTPTRVQTPTRVDPYTVRQRRMEALHQAWVEDPRSGLHIGGPGGLGPSPFLMDRHARCLEQLTLPPPPLRPSSPSAPSPWAREEEEVENVVASALPERPHTSCGVVGLEGDPYDLSPPQRDNMSRVQRYIDCHRPDSASSARSVMRKELEGTYRRSLGTRGKSPHFCNFVHKVDLHARYDTGHARASTGSDDEERNDSTLSDPTDQDILAQWRKHSRLTGSGTEGRPGSPSSVDGRHAQDRNASNTNTNVIDASEEDVRSVSVIVNHFVNSEGESVIRPESMVTQDDQQNDEDAVVHESEVSGKDPAGPSRKDIATMTTTKTSTKPRVIKTFISPPPPAPRVRMIPTITIPSSPLPSAEQPLSNRTSEETSPRKSAREDSDLRSESVERSRERPSSASRPPPKEAKDKADKAKRAPVAKKTKKSSERRRKSKSASMEHAPTVGSASAEAPAAGDASSQPTTNGLDVDVKVPDLPGVPTSGKDRHGKKSRKGERRLISPPVVGEKPQLPPELLELDSYPRNGYDFSDMESAVTENYNNKFRLQSWMNSRIALSQQASRFELPMDMKLLEQISTQDYLRKFCVVTSRRVNLYQKIFIKHKDKSNTLNKQGLETCLKETLVQALKENTYTEICDLLDITDETVVDFKLFSGVAAIIERILYPFYTTEDTIEMPEFQRERIETADFQALDWKLHGIKVSPKMRKLLKMLQ